MNLKVYNAAWSSFEHRNVFFSVNLHDTHCIFYCFSVISFYSYVANSSNKICIFSRVLESKVYFIILFIYSLSSNILCRWLNLQSAGSITWTKQLKNWLSWKTKWISSNPGWYLPIKNWQDRKNACRGSKIWNLLLKNKRWEKEKM